MSRKLKLLRWIPLFSILGDISGCFPVGGMTPRSFEPQPAAVAIEPTSALPSPVEGLRIPESHPASSNQR